jgi:hypothetical protein
MRWRRGASARGYGARLGAERRLIDGQHFAVAHDDLTGDHGHADGACWVAIDELTGEVVERSEGQRVEVEHDQISLVTGRDATDLVAATHATSTAAD